MNDNTTDITEQEKQSIKEKIQRQKNNHQLAMEYGGYGYQSSETERDKHGDLR